MGWISENDVLDVDKAVPYSLIVTAPSAIIYSKNCKTFGCLPQDIHMRASLGTYFQSIDFSNGWWTVNIPQKNSTSNLQGYVVETQVTTLHKLKSLSSSDLRYQIVETAKLLLGRYYLWGGRSSFLENLWITNEHVTGVDCSGLISLSFKAK